MGGHSSVKLVPVRRAIGNWPASPLSGISGILAATLDGLACRPAYDFKIEFVSDCCDNSSERITIYRHYFASYYTSETQPFVSCQP